MLGTEIEILLSPHITPSFLGPLLFNLYLSLSQSTDSRLDHHFDSGHGAKNANRFVEFEL